jgi:hypothetical protein
VHKPNERREQLRRAPSKHDGEELPSSRRFKFSRPHQHTHTHTQEMRPTKREIRKDAFVRFMILRDIA